MVKEACDFLVLGNHDEYLFDLSSIDSHTNSPLIVRAVEQCRDELRPEELRFVESFARKVSIPVQGDSGLLLFHGSPDSNNQELLSETPEDELSRHLSGHSATVMVGGHTHVQMLRQHRGRLVVNPGSVGLPFERFAVGGPPTLLAHAEYAIVEFRDGNVGVDLRRLPLDRTLLAEAARSWTGPLASYLAAQYA